MDLITDVSELLERYAEGERDFSKAFLAGQDLSAADLREANLRFVNLKDANLSNANLSNANLRGANLIKANLVRANLIGTDLIGINLIQGNLSEADLRWTNFIKSTLENSNLKDANLERANLAHANLKKADLTDADLTDANLAGADLTGAILEGAKLEGTILDQSLQNKPPLDIKFILTSQQTDFIERLKYNNLLCSNIQGYHSELTIISGQELINLRQYCWDMVDKYKKRFPNAESKKIFINNLKGKLGEEVVKKRLGDLVSEIDYDIYHGGDGGIDLKLTQFPDVGLQIKARTGSYENIRWTFKQSEIEKNKVLVCVLIAEEVNEAQSEYNLILSGFLPTDRVKIENETISYKIQDLWYGGGLKTYLQLLTSNPE